MSSLPDIARCRGLIRSMVVSLSLLTTCFRPIPDSSFRFVCEHLIFITHIIVALLMDLPKEGHIRVAEDTVNSTAIGGPNIYSIRHKSSNPSLGRRSTREKDAEDPHTNERDIRTKQVCLPVHPSVFGVIDERIGVWWPLSLLVGPSHNQVGIVTHASS